MVSSQGSPLGSEGQHDVFLVGGEFEPEHPGVSHHGARDDHPAGTSGSVDHHEALVHVPVDVLGVAHPGTVPRLRAVVIVQNFLQVEGSFKIISGELRVPLPSAPWDVFIILFCFRPKLGLKFRLQRNVNKLAGMERGDLIKLFREEGRPIHEPPRHRGLNLNFLNSD